MLGSPFGRSTYRRLTSLYDKRSIRRVGACSRNFRKTGDIFSESSLMFYFMCFLPLKCLYLSLEEQRFENWDLVFKWFHFLEKTYLSINIESHCALYTFSIFSNDTFAEIFCWSEFLSLSCALRITLIVLSSRCQLFQILNSSSSKTILSTKFVHFAILSR